MKCGWKYFEIDVMRMSDTDNVSVLGYSIYAKSLDDFEYNEKCIVNTLNAYSYVMAKSDEDFKTALMHSDLLIPDGFPIVLAARMLQKRKIEKIAGMDLFFHLCTSLDKSGGKCFFF